MGIISARSARVALVLGWLAVLVVGWSNAHAAMDALTLGLPDRHLPSSPGPGGVKLDDLVRKALRNLACDSAACPERTLQVNVAVGSDYEILDWFGKGLLDLAVVPEISAVLLKRDVDTVEIARPAGMVDGRRRSAPAKRALDANATEQLERYSRWVWCRAEAERGWVEWLKVAARKPTVACDGVGTAGGPYLLEVFSHLHGFAPPLDVAATWLEAQFDAPLRSWQCPPRTSGAVSPSELAARAARASLEDAFWQEFLHHTRFTFGQESSTTSTSGTTRIRPPVWNRDRLIASRQTARRLGIADFRVPTELPSAVERMWDRRCLNDSPAEIAARAPKPFRSLLLPEPRFGVRTFAFSVRESIELLRRHRQQHVVLRPPSGDAADEVELALVLPGGGVKAAYQSVMIERLYGLSEGQRLLRNVGVTTERTPGPLDVHYVIGTSGGALLGYFTSRLSGAGPWRLDTALWQRCQDGHCRDLSSIDVFGRVDLLRYASAVAIYWVLALLLGFCLALSMFHRAFSLGVGANAGPTPPTKWRGRLIVALAPVLLLMPFAVRLVNGDAGREHIPEIEGFFYALCILIAMFAEECVVYRDGEPRERGKYLLGLGLIALGLIAVAAPAVTRWRHGQSKTWLEKALLSGDGGGLFVQLGALVVCLGGALVLIGTVTWTAASRKYVVVNIRGFLAGAALALLHIGLVFVVVYQIVDMFPESGVSLLELTYQYWVALLAVAFVSALAIVVARAFVVRWWAAPVLVSGIDYLSSNHPNGGMIPRRFFRLALMAVFGLVWWNIVIAPAIYGNASALAFLNSVESNFKAANGPSTALTTRLIVTANLLDVDGARYFAFLPKAHDCLALPRRTGYGAEWRVYSGAAGEAVPLLEDQTAACEKGRGPWKSEMLRHVVFASGSPYPVFPAHRVTDEDGRYVDGGYANNVPLDAAQAVGADQVLIVESSNPLGHDEKIGLLGWVLGAVQGDLVSNAPRLMAFLWDRSQQMDRISRRELLVVCLAPRREESPWPSLVEFTGLVVRKMKATAERDFDENHRIGSVQSWGRPRLVNTVSMPRSATGTAR